MRRYLNLLIVGLIGCMLMVGCGLVPDSAKDLVSNIVDDIKDKVDDSEEETQTEESEKADVEQEETSKPQEENSETEKDSTAYPIEIQLSKGEEEGIKDMFVALTWIGEVDFPHDVEGTKRFCNNFAMMSMLGGQGVFQRIASAYPDTHIEEYYLYFSEETLKQYLMDSIGYNDISTMKANAQPFDYFDYVGYNGSEFRVMAPDTGEMWVEGGTIEKVVALSPDEILVTGYTIQTAVGSPSTYFLEARFKKNVNSVWGGYTLVEILRSDLYILPTSNSEYLTEDDLRLYDEYYLRLARNEIYARHGYRFKDQGLQYYFNARSWYNPTTDNVPESQLNEYEKANLDLILGMESRLKQ